MVIYLIPVKRRFYFFTLCKKYQMLISNLSISYKFKHSYTIYSMFKYICCENIAPNLYGNFMLISFQIRMRQQNNVKFNTAKFCFKLM